MTKLQIQAELSDEQFHRFQEEARRRGVEPESLVEEAVKRLLRELELGADQGDVDRVVLIS